MVHLLLAVIYLAFISLGLPDSLLGSAWPSMHLEFGVPVSYAGVISMIIALGTVVSSLQSDRLTRRLGAGMVTALSVLLTALALLGFFAEQVLSRPVPDGHPLRAGRGQRGRGAEQLRGP